MIDLTKYKYLPSLNSVEVGWHQLIEDICIFINSKVNINDFTVDQIKQKFGSLRFYVTFSDNVNKETRIEVDSYIHKREQDSLFICEDCGAKGTKVWEKGWLYTLCEKCAVKN